MSNQTIKAPKWLKRDLQLYNRHNESADKISRRIGQYLERIGYETDTGWDGRLRLNVVSGKVEERNGVYYLKVEGFAFARSNGDGVFCHQICHFEDSYSGEFYIPCDDGEYIQVKFSC